MSDQKAEQMVDGVEQKTIETIQKLLNLAAKAGTPAEAEAAMGKAQELMVKHNLDQATVEGGDKGRRLKDQVTGGFLEWNRWLWQHVADAHFCVYWSQKYRTEEKVPQTHRVGGIYVGMRMVHAMRRRHALVGRQVNVKLAIGMAQYLEGCIERALKERLQGDPNAQGENMKSKWAHDFRKGAAYRLMSKLQDRRDEMKAKEEQERRRAERAARGASTGTSLTISTLEQTEQDANMDFLYGEGWSAKRRAEREERAREREERIRAQREWAAANPEEAARLAEEERKREERNAKRRTGRARYGGGSKDRTDWSAYYAGQDAAESIGLDPQAETRRAGQRRLA